MHTCSEHTSCCAQQTFRQRASSFCFKLDSAYCYFGVQTFVLIYLDIPHVQVKVQIAEALVRQTTVQQQQQQQQQQQRERSSQPAHQLRDGNVSACQGQWSRHDAAIEQLWQQGQAGSPPGKFLGR